MELTAVVEAIRALKRPCHLVIHTDSRYLKDGITSWIRKWKRNGWKTSTGAPVKNKDLWLALDEASQRHTIDWNWVKGHAGHPENERCDELARSAILDQATHEVPEAISRTKMTGRPIQAPTSGMRNPKSHRRFVSQDVTACAPFPDAMQDPRHRPSPSVPAGPDVPICHSVGNSGDW